MEKGRQGQGREANSRQAQASPTAKAGLLEPQLVHKSSQEVGSRMGRGLLTPNTSDAPIAGSSSQQECNEKLPLKGTERTKANTSAHLQNLDG